MTVITLAGLTINCFDEVSSTNDIAKQARINAQDIKVILAHSQTAGRGRQDRKWESLEGNLFFSILVCPKKNIEAWPQLSLLSGLALAETLKPLLPKNAIELKWPNDLLINHNKVAGILLESVLDKTPKCIIGIGVNTQAHPEAIEIATSHLAEYTDIENTELLEAFLNNWKALYHTWQQEGFAFMRPSWLNYCTKVNQPVTLHTAGEQIEAIMKDIDDQGNLIIEHDNKEKVINAGEILQ